MTWLGGPMKLYDLPKEEQLDWLAFDDSQRDGGG